MAKKSNNKPKAPKKKPVTGKPVPKSIPPNTNIKTNTMTTKSNVALPELSSTSLVAEEAAHSQTVNVTFTFTGGLGQATTLLFRKGVLINMQSLSSSGNINFSEVQSGDVISVNGVCTGNANLVINTPTTPATPEQFASGIIIAGYLIN